MRKLWYFIEKLLGVYRWHPKVALRYLPIVEIIKKAGLKEESLLEVGSGGLGITPYIKRQVVGLDRDFAAPLHPQLVPVKGSAESIPFIRDAFTTVVSVDMLEHLPPEKRAQAISEMIRVGQKLICIGVPCGGPAEKQDQQLKRLYESTRNSNFQFFDEQVEYGLPTADWMLETISWTAKRLGKYIQVETTANVNLSLRKILMRGWIADNFPSNFFFRKILLPVIPLFRRFNQAPAYRQLFFVTIK